MQQGGLGYTNEPTMNSKSVQIAQMMFETFWISRLGSTYHTCFLLRALMFLTLCWSLENQSESLWYSRVRNFCSSLRVANKLLLLTKKYSCVEEVSEEFSLSRKSLFVLQVHLWWPHRKRSQKLSKTIRLAPMALKELRTGDLRSEVLFEHYMLHCCFWWKWNVCLMQL